jgi:hypothetical protein
MLPVYSAGQARLRLAGQTLLEKKIIFTNKLIINYLEAKMLQKGYENVTLCSLEKLQVRRK